MTSSPATAQVAAAHLVRGDTIIIDESRYAVLATAQVAAAHLLPGDTIVIDESRYAVLCREPRWRITEVPGLTFLMLYTQLVSLPPQVRHLGNTEYEMPHALLFTVVRREE